MTTRILAIANQKGGVGKTTTSVNLAASLAKARRRVLLVDLDPQGNATTGAVGAEEKKKLKLSTYDVLTGRAELAAVIRKAEQSGFDLLPANGDLSAVDDELRDVARREYRLADALGTMAGRHDFVLIDCAPSLSILTINALAAANGVLIPVQCEYYALEGLVELMKTIEGVRRTLNRELRTEGIVRVMYDARSNLAQHVSAQLVEYYGDLVYDCIIPRNVTLAEAPSFGRPVLQHAEHSRGSKAYLALAGELVHRESPVPGKLATRAPAGPDARSEQQG